MKNKLLFVFLIVLFAALLFLIKALRDAASRRRILHFGDRAEREVKVLLQKAFPSYFVLSNLYFKKGGGTTQIDHILLSPKGIFVIETKSHNGYIETKGDRWVQYRNEKVVTFHSPLLQNKIHTNALEEVLRKAGWEKKIPLHSLVVFTSNKVEFSKKKREVILSKDLIPRIRDLEKGVRPLSPNSLLQLKRIILVSSVKTNSVKREHARRMRNRNGQK